MTIIHILILITLFTMVILGISNCKSDSDRLYCPSCEIFFLRMEAKKPSRTSKKKRCKCPKCYTNRIVKVKGEVF